MDFLLRKVFGRFRRSKDTPAQLPESRTGAFYPLPLPLGEAGALSVGAVFRCVRLLGDSVAALPLLYQRRRGEIFATLTDDRLHYLLNVQPSPGCNAFYFWRDAVQQVLLDGNAYIVPAWSEAGVERLTLCSRGSVTHDTVRGIYHVDDPYSGLRADLGEDEVVHFMGPTLRDPAHGLSVLTYTRLTTDIAAEGASQTLNRFRNGGDVRGIISNAVDTGARFGKYRKEQLDNAAADFDSRLRGGERILGLAGDARFSQISTNAADMQFLETRKFTVLDICRFFGVPPSFVFADTASNYKSVEQADIDFLAHTLNPMLRAFETELLRKLVPAAWAPRYRISFDRRGLYACDLNGRARYQAATIASGLYTVNDWRREENRAPVAGGDTVLVSANLRTLSEINNSNNTPSKQ